LSWFPLKPTLDLKQFPSEKSTHTSSVNVLFAKLFKIELTNQLEELNIRMISAENAETELREKLEEERKLREEAEFKLEENEINNDSKTYKTPRMNTPDEDDLEDFGDQDGPDNSYLLGEIEDLKQQIIDLQDEKNFIEDEFTQKIESERDQKNKLHDEVQAMKIELQNAVCNENSLIE
jgi:hypothetical protein